MRQAVLALGYRHGVTVQLRFLVWPALLAYILAAYTAVRLFLAHAASSHADGLALMIGRCVEAGLVVSLAVVETLR